MPGNREVYKSEASYEWQSNEEFEARVKERKKRSRRRNIRRKVLLVILLIAAFATLATMCGRDIIKLQNENRELKKQQKELEEERDKLKSEVERAGDREYLQEQARKQLHLLNPGEILFTFDDENAPAEKEPAETEVPEENIEEETEEKIQGDG